MSEAPTPLSIRQLLTSGDYLIPMYQRNYAWGEAEIRQLIRDVIDSLPKSRSYHLGSLVVSEREIGDSIVYETIDGQQRLTTLALLACYLKNETTEDLRWYERLPIRFESRAHSTTTLGAIFNGTLIKEDPLSLKGTMINGAILAGYRLIQQCLQRELKECGTSLPEFVRFLMERVCVMRVKVPRETDLNHYFEIMNNRGEQLEKHEVLKSRLMKALDESCPEEEREANRQCLHAVWVACADMECYVQTRFTPAQRNEIFGHRDWGRFDPTDFASLRTSLRSAEGTVTEDSQSLTLEQIIDGPAPIPGKGQEEASAPERFNTVINFPNFLLHVLRVTTGEDVALDDKQLIPEFEKHVIKAQNPGEAVKGFIYSLLRCKYRYDHHVLKREFIGGKDRWSLKRCKWRESGSREGSASYVNTFGNAGEEDSDEGINRRLIMLLSAFHVSTPTMAYKYWLNAALTYLHRTEEISADGYLAHLESVACAFVFDRFLSPGEGAGYYEMIQVRKGFCVADPASVSQEAIAPLLKFHEIRNNLVFNYLDYLLWLKYRDTDSTFRNWEFTFRSSVEHFYPQTPMAELPTLPETVVHRFGNLCLISHSKNSRLSNFTPKAKQEFYPGKAFDSIKQRLMLNEQEWNEAAILQHEKEMLDCLCSTNDGNLKGIPSNA
jgi:hypothetical protein